MKERMRLTQSFDDNPRYFPEEYFELKTKIHDQLLEIVDLSLIEQYSPETLRGELKKLLQNILRDNGLSVPLNSLERERLITEIQDEVLGLGPLEPFLQDPTVSDILVNTYSQIYVERFGKLELTEGRFQDNAHMMKIIDKIVSSVGRRVDESSPMVDARLADGSRVNAIIPPLAIDGPIMSIRRFAVDTMEMEDLLTGGTVSPEIAEILKGVV
ncbi:MAG: ATPase, T2SS/T4P/T4SS family, partial [Desulfosalsimonas sp.]